jgi:hypothetical protein
MRLKVAFVSAALALASAARAADPGAILDANHQASGGAAWARKASVSLQYAYSGQGLTGVVGTRYDLGSGAFVDSYDLGVNTGGNGFDGRQAWMRDPSGAITPQAGGDTRLLAVNEAYRDANRWWAPDRGGARIESLGERSEDGGRFAVLSITPPAGKSFEAWFDGSTHLLARIVEAQGFQTITTFLSDYRSTEGAQFPGKVVIDDGSGVQYRQTQTLTQARFEPPAAAGSFAMPLVHLTDSAIENADGRATVPFKLLNNHIYADVMVNGKGPFLFIFDTGGHDLLTPETAKALAVKTQGAAAGTGAGEGVVDVGFARGVTLRIGDLVMKDQAVSILDFASLPVEGFDERGMIGFEVFRRYVTRVDYGAGTLTFIRPDRFDPKDAGTPVPFVFYNHLPQVDGRFEGVPGHFDIDTGSRVELTLTKPFVEAQGLMAKHPKGVNAVDGWGVGGRARSYVTRGAEFDLGPVQVDGVVASFGTQAKGAFADPSYQGNVGTGLLKRFVVTFDYDHQVMYLKPISPTPPDIGTFDRAGLWINAAPKGFEIVDLTAGGPAEKAGLKVGDKIVAVDGAPAESITLSDFRRRLRDGQPGTRVNLTVESGGQSHPVSVTLRDQI